MNQVRNEEIRKRLNQEAVVETMRRRQRTWKEKVEHMDEDRLARRVYEEGIPGKRCRGRPRKKWTDNFK